MLDSTTISELSTLSRSFVKVASPAKGNVTKSVGRSSSFEKTKPEQKSPRLMNKKTTNFFCKIHSEE